MMNFQNYDKLRGSLRYWLLGKGYHMASRAMEFGMLYHTGTRKDGKTPEFLHQVSQAQYMRTFLPHLIHPEETLATIFLHDVVEDYKVPPKIIYSDFGELVGRAVELMSDQIFGVEKDVTDYYRAMIEDPIASIDKGGDRLHNYQTMVGVFTLTKQTSYVEEGTLHILPMLKAARKRWPQQEPAYQNISQVLRMQMELITEMIAARGPVLVPVATTDQPLDKRLNKV